MIIDINRANQGEMLVQRLVNEFVDWVLFNSNKLDLLEKIVKVDEHRRTIEKT